MGKGKDCNKILIVGFSHHSKRVVYHNVHRSSIYNSQDMEAT